MRIFSCDIYDMTSRVLLYMIRYH